MTFPLPDPILVHLGPIPVYWYGICYALGLVAVYLVATREARRKGLDHWLVTDGMIVIAVAALIGGRAYHVIDRWNDLYANNIAAIFLPPYTGLGVYGGLITGTLAALVYIRWKRQSFWGWADVTAPALFAMQLVGRWGNFFNQELYGPPTNLPWGIPIDCAHRIPAYPCAAFPFDTTRFQPLFLYESLSGLIGLLVLLFLARRFASRLRSGDLLGIFFIWYAVVRFSLEALRANNWTFNGIPTAWLFSAGFIAAGVAILALRRLGGGRSMADDDAGRLAAASAMAAPDVATEAIGAGAGPSGSVSASAGPDAASAAPDAAPTEAGPIEGAERSARDAG